MANMVKKDGGSMLRDLLSFDPFAMFQARGRSEEMTWNPSIEVRETDESYVFEADVPGMKPQDLDVTLTGNRLQIAGKREQTREEGDEKSTYHTWERSYGSFCRTFTLPQHADLEHVKSELKDGVLKLVVPKQANAKQQTKKIQVGSSTSQKS